MLTTEHMTAMLTKIMSFIRPVEQCISVEQPKVYVEIIPRQIVDVVSKPFNQVALPGGQSQDALGYQTVHDAVIDAQHVGFALLGKVVPENLFFFFGETVKALQNSFFSFHAQRSIPYDPHDFYAPIYCRYGGGSNQRNAEPLAIVLCKVVNAQCLGGLVADKQQYAAKQHDCYQVSWSELQELYELFGGQHADGGDCR